MNKSIAKRLSGLASVLMIGVFMAACGTTPAAAPAPAPAPAPTAPAPANPAFPTKPIRIVITHAAGGSTDAVARLIQSYVSKNLGGNPIVIENMVGAGGNIARAHVFNADPDGHTLLASQFPSMQVGQLVQNGAFKTTEMTPIFQITGNQAQMAVVPYDSPAQDFKQLVELSKTKSMSMSGPGLGTNGHLAFALFQKAGLNGTYIPFNSGPEALTAVAGKQTDLATADSVSMASLIAEKKIRVLATSGLERDPNLPDVPTLIELGHTGLGFDISIGIIAPPKTPDYIVKILSDAFAAAAKDADFLAKAKAAKYPITGMPAAQFKTAISADYKLVEGFVPLLKAK